MKSPDLVNPAERSRPFNPNAYYDRCRGRRQEQKEDRPARSFITFRYWNKPATSQLETHMRAIANTSAEKPRWQKIIEHASSLADERGMTCEEFYSMALVEFIEKLENEKITEQLNEAYKNIDQEEDVAFLNRVVSHYDPRLADE